jgi:hypothetical protein
MAAVAAVFAGVGEEVAENLFEARRVGLQKYRLGGHRERQLLVARGTAGAREACGGGEDGLERHWLFPQLDFPLGDARDIQQVVNHPAHVFDLPADDALRLGAIFVAHAGGL